MPVFEHRPFPPPSLVDVPEEYIIDQLRSLSSEYWDHPETSDCTIVVPVPQHRARGLFEEPDPLVAPPPTYDPMGRRATEPSLPFMPRITMNLHIDYLLAHSRFLRGLFSGASPIDLANPSSSSYRTPSGQYTIPPDRIPRLMPSSTPAHPVLLLHVPDPLSIHLLIHWMYFGSYDLIDDALKRGVAEWEGLARNVEYLGLPNDIKVFLGRWYAKRMEPHTDADASDEESDDDEDDGGSETAYSEDDEDIDMDSETDVGVVENLKIEDDEPSRGRDRATRCLSWTSTHSSISSYSSSSLPPDQDTLS